jgi:2-polyprenyl-3-methyl-5-hydroxy-6-metoxy-1,4-benzoquinol methylase
MKRQFDPAEPELMDRPQPVSAELEIDLRNLRRLNRYFGSYALVRRFLQEWLEPHTKMRFLDLATGSGDIPRLIVDEARKIGAEVRIDAIDQQASTLEIARRLSAGYPEIDYHCTDAFEWSAAEPYDVVLCSLALHHFSENEAVRLLQHCHELTGRFVLITDLRRSWLNLIGIYLLSFAFREEMTRHDARASARRAFSLAEFRLLAQRAGWKNFHHRRFRFARQAIWFDQGFRKQ